MTKSVRDTLCVHNAASPDTDHVCDWCQSMIDFQPQRGWNAPLHPEEHERAMALFGGPNGTSSRKWNALLANTQDFHHVQWARLDNDDDPITKPPESWGAFEELTQAVLRGDHLTQRQEAMLREGIGFHDGSVLRYLDGVWNLNGCDLHGLSLFVVFSLMENASKRKGWDIPALLVCATSVNPELRHPSRMVQYIHHRGRRELRPSYRPLAAMLTWLSTRLKIDRTLNMEAREYVPMMAWSHDIQSRMFDVQPPNMEGMFQKALSHHPPGLFHAYNTPWMQAWRELEPAHEQAETQKWAMDLNPKALRFRTRTASGSLRLIRVPSEPALWALLSSLVLSPLNSEAGKLLLGLQHNWSVGYIERNLPSAPLVRSLEFCHSIMNGLETKVFLERARVLIIGQFGHVYEVAVEHGQHGAPYTIQHVTDITPNVKRPICIHSGQFANTLPLGDTMGSVILSMVNDIKASGEIQSLEELLFHHPPFGFPRHNIPTAWIDHLRNDAVQAANPPRFFLHQLRWFRPDPVDELEPRPGGGLHDLFLRNRHHGRRRPPRFSERWAARFHTVFDREGRFPLEEAVAEWRETVPPYVPGRTEVQGFGDYFGRIQEGFFHRRYHHLMPHRRGDDLHEEGDVRDGERRWCEVFARVWEVLVHQPLGAHFRLPLRDGGPLAFQHADLQVTVRSELERNFFTRAARMLGYVRDEEDPTHAILVRRDHPRPNARLQLTDLLRDMQDRQRVRGAPPRWWNYVDVVAPPREVPHFRWQLHLDHRDTQRVVEFDEPVDREFNGLGEFVE